ncbi:hypothetical protein F511_17203 [Dorcoceras hygrometricum]|uniref:Uncharacterized protein n=1 Tax=Dorcoceras hygrometricum TaxID=472368 RepID=A0A2Z7CZH2_9LAMI|nr:hypothetical protein F511_17203 [Dorcoceras hygrometricum]
MAYVILSVNRYLATGTRRNTQNAAFPLNQTTSLPRSLSQLHACCQQQPSQAQLLPDATQDVTLMSSLLISKIHQTFATVLLTRVDFRYRSLLLTDFAEIRYVWFLALALRLVFTKRRRFTPTPSTADQLSPASATAEF